VYKKVFIGLMIAVISTASMAEWVGIGTSTGKSSADLYVDLSTVRRSGEVVKMWTLWDYKSPVKNLDGSVAVSIKTLYEFHCRNEALRTLYVAQYDEHMGNGGSVRSFNSPNSEWEPAIPQSIAATFLAIGCAKK
jgi:hypothetical protein